MKKGTLKFHVSWDAGTTVTSLAGAIGRLRSSGQITQPNPIAVRSVPKGQIDGLGLHLVIVDGVNASAVTVTKRGSVRNRALNATRSVRTSTKRTLARTFRENTGLVKISRRFPALSFHGDRAKQRRHPILNWAFCSGSRGRGVK